MRPRTRTPGRPSAGSARTPSSSTSVPTSVSSWRVVARQEMNAAGVHRALVILAAEDEAEIARVAAVSAAWPECRFAVGVHPHHAHLFAINPQDAAAVVAARLDALPLARAVGEIGLDYHYDFSPRDVQHAVFRAQLQLARSRDLPASADR